MAFFRKIKQAFGFSDSEMDETIGIDATVTPLVTNNLSDSPRTAMPTAELPSGEEPADDCAVDGTVTNVLPEQIFETVVSIFNESLPAFVGSSVDAEAQRRYLYNALDDSMKEYLTRLDENARSRCEARWEQRRRNLESQMEAMREKMKKDEGESNDVKKLQLSAERQKRALTDRVRDLENQLTTMQAENEQYILENKTLVNRLRVAAVKGEAGADGEPLADPELLAELEQTRKRETELMELLDRERGRSESAATELQELQTAHQQLSERFADAEKEIAKLNEGIEKSRVKDDLGDAMLTELNEKAATLEKRSVGLEQEKEALEKELQAVKESLAMAESSLEEARQAIGAKSETEKDEAEKLAELENENIELKETVETLTADLLKAREDLNVISDIQQQIETLEVKREKEKSEMKRLREEIVLKDSLISQKDAYMKEADYSLKKKNEEVLHCRAEVESLTQAIENLRDQLDIEAARNEKLEAKNNSLRKTIETNLYEQTQAEAAMRSEIERLKALSVAAEPASGYGVQPPVVERKRRGRRTNAERAAAERAAREAATGSPVIDPTAERKAVPTDPADAAKQEEPVADKVVSSVKISAIDESLDNIDWLSPTPPPRKKKSSSTPENVDSEFGYHEPERRQTPESPAQMSLW